MQSTCPIFERNGYFFLNYLQFASTPLLLKPSSKTVVPKVWSAAAASKSPENLDMQILRSHPRQTQLGSARLTSSPGHSDEC